MILLNIVMAPTATSPPYFDKEALKQILMALSVALIINGETPRARIGSNIFFSILKYVFLIWRIDFFPVRNFNTQTAEIP